MAIQVYAHEIIDGLGEVVRSNDSIAYTMEISETEQSEKLWMAMASSAWATNLNQEDLFYLKSVLVSTGWNLNDDIFTPEYLWASRKTPEDKQFNFMHNESDIIGHITSNEVYDFFGEVVLDTAEKIPEDFNIITNAVIYRSWSNSEQKNRIEKLISEIKENKWFVSMECIFPDFDYALKSSTGEVRLVPRNEASAFLTKHLRAYGGTGVYEDYKIGRVLKDLIFSGKGLVNTPANPRSVILRSESEKISYANIQEIDMSVEDKSKEFDALSVELVNTKAELLNAQSTIQSLNSVKAEVESLKTEISAKEETVASLLAEKISFEETIASLKASLEASEAARVELDNRVKDIEAKARLESRKVQLTEAGFDAEELEDALASFDSMEDASFEKMVAVMKKKGKKKEDKPMDEEETETYADVLDTATKVEDATAGLTETEEEDPADKLRAEAVNFFHKTLASTKK